MANQTYETTCCVVGGGPAGMMLAYLLARAGVAVTVLEKHNDFFRDFRGDTVHPSTLELMYELGILEDFLKVPHQKLRPSAAYTAIMLFGSATSAMCRRTASSSLSCRSGISWTSSPARPGSSLLSNFGCSMMRSTSCAMAIASPELRRRRLTARCKSARTWSSAAMAVTPSLARQRIWKSRSLVSPSMCLWFRITRTTNDPEQLLGNINYGRALILIPRSDYFQAGLVIPKGSFEELQRQGLDVFAKPASPHRSLSRRSRRGTARLGPDQAANGANQPAAAMASSRSTLHWRCGPCNVPCWWSRN